MALWGGQGGSAGGGVVSKCAQVSRGWVLVALGTLEQLL
jgi:hypothetical protein